MGLRDAARWMKEKIIGKKDAQEPQKEDRREEPDISSEKDEVALAIMELYGAKDKWQKEKLIMSNNERRRRGMPMVRRQQHLRNMRNQRRRRGKASYERREKP